MAKGSLTFERGEGSRDYLDTSYKSGQNFRFYLLVAMLACFVCLAVGFVIGWFAHPAKSQNHTSDIPTTTGKILSGLSRDKIKEYHKFLTNKPRLTATDGEFEAVDYIVAQMSSHGLDSVKVKSYDVLMSYPNSSNPNKVQVLSGGTVLFQSQPYEKGLSGEDNSKIVPPYNSFAPAGQAQGKIIYVNYGRIEDFLFLRDNLSVDFTNTLVIARYGRVFRGDKLKNAWKFNASGLILFTDPADFNADNSSKTYPDSWWMPPSGLQRGTVGGDGDYLTPFYPATDYAYRLDVSEVDLPKIPCQPIGYGDAYHILSRMGGRKAPTAWQGGLNFTYHIGPDMDDPLTEVRLEVNNYVKIRPVKNIIATIKGSLEPDRYVILGNHHDTWVYGAIDPLSGSAAALEISRVFGNMLKTGWRPRRTIVICSWSGEEEGLLGSTEWVEDHMKVLYERAVAYLNVDYTVDFTYALAIGTSPLLQDSIFEATKKIPNPTPSNSEKTLYDIWKKHLPADKSNPDTEPEVYYSLGSGSDMATFYQRAGVPSTDMYYTYDQNRWPILSYPLYHSAYETYHMYSAYIDPSYNYTLAMAQLWAILACDIAEANILPFNAKRYSTAIEKFVTEKEELFGQSWKLNNVNLKSLKSAAKNFSQATAKFHEMIKDLDSPSELKVRQINDRLMNLERAFIDPEGLPGRRIYKHVVFAPSKYDSYSDNSFPGIVDTMVDIEQNNLDKWDLLKQQVFVATHSVAMATNTLDDVGL
ncbi:LOW QUALITY PROTEIN: N-acetylated-alpha-linked acidic dipeptidase 2-like [Liolophura sinensis]|uniref:LOW QUALITY PROTEIN: N-acetylated-alpha-linked acidic dipeptidase 2-like n=1 Tax=Liolophura sinensis TaxID=3198878 RepID=UPI00315883A2